MWKSPNVQGDSSNDLHNQASKRKVYNFSVHLLFNHNHDQNEQKRHKQKTRWFKSLPKEWFHWLLGSHLSNQTIWFRGETWLKITIPKKGASWKPKSMAASLLFSKQSRCQVRSPTAEGWPPVKRENVFGRQWSPKRLPWDPSGFCFFFFEAVDFKFRKYGSENLWPYQLMIFPTYPPSDNGPWNQISTKKFKTHPPRWSMFLVSCRDWKHPGILPKRTGESHSNINLGLILTPKSKFQND